MCPKNHDVKKCQKTQIPRPTQDGTKLQTKVTSLLQWLRSACAVFKNLCQSCKIKSQIRKTSKALQNYTLFTRTNNNNLVSNSNKEKSKNKI